MNEATQTTNRPVFFISAGVILLFVLLSALFTKQVGSMFTMLQGWIVANFGWFYVLATAGFLFFVFFLFFSSYGLVRLGQNDEEPEYSYATWFAMLFSAGMGIGLLFYGVAEPILHYTAPLVSQPGTTDAAREAMELAFFHWGLHAWAIYIVVGLSLAYFAYRHDLPLTIRSTLYPLLGRRIYGPAGDAVEILAVFGTLFGVATSLGLGVMQINAGLNYLGLLPESTANQIWLIAGITILATVSVVTGLDRGMRRLSEINLGLALALLLFVFFAGPTIFLLSSFVQSLGHYAQTLLGMSFRTTPFQGIEWQASWTMFYWGWWISWSPFVGMFIARISRGRTIREFIGGALFAPTLLTFFWFIVFGNTALHMEIFGPGGISAAVADSVPTAIFAMLDRLPWPLISSTLATLVVATFFITSSDSASLVIDIMTTNGNPNPPVITRVFWATTEGVVAAVLLLAGGLQALQTAAVTTALPFSFVMILMCWSLMRGLSIENKRGAFRAAAISPATLAPAEETEVEDTAQTSDWRAQLQTLIGRQRPSRGHTDTETCRPRIRRFMDEEVDPAFKRLAAELQRNGRGVQVDRHPFQATLVVLREGNEEFTYTLRGRTYRRMPFAFPELRGSAGEPICLAEILLRGGTISETPLEGFTRDQIIQNFLAEYAKWMGW